jgi:NSS family neurotransmitter:Na+ symporter
LTNGRETWTGRFGFLMATAGFAIGLGNIWRFPYLTGMNGGGAFLLVYVGFAVLIGIPLMTAELSLGRKAQLTPIAGMRSLTGTRWSPWNLIGWLGCTAALLILSYYVMLIGWILGYFVMIVSGDLTSASPESLADTYAAFVSTPGPVLAYTYLVIAALGLMVSQGLSGGLERVAKFAMPVLLVLLLILAARSLTLPGAADGLRWYLTPDFSALTGRAMLDALGQAFYSIGIGMAAAFGFGSYMQRTSTDVPGNATIVVLADTGVAFVAGLVIFPALFSFGLEPNEGPGLLFVTMTNLFTQMPAGQLFGAAFFLLMILAAVTSAGAVQEVLTSTLNDLVPMGRRTATWGFTALLAVLATPIVLALGPWSGVQVFGMDLFTLVDTVSGRFILPAGALLLSLYVVFVWGYEVFASETNAGAGLVRVNPTWKPFMLVIIPVAVALVLLLGIGVI